MAYDSHANLIKVTVTVAPSTPTGGTTLSVSNADGAILRGALTAPFNVTICPSSGVIDPANSEILRVTAIGAADSGGTGNTQLTVTRQAETGGINRSILVGDIIYQTITKKTLTDIETAIPSIANYTGAMTGGNYTITTTATDLAGVTITLPNAGTYLVLANVLADESTPGTGSPVTIQLIVNGVANTQTLNVFDNSSSIGDFEVSLHGAWIVTTTGANQIVKLQVSKAFNTGTYVIVAASTVLNAIRLG